MASTFNKEIRRSITGSLGRFLAIAAIVALGCGFYAGLRMTAPDMKLAADEFYDGTALMDLRVVSTLGLTDADMDALRGTEGVEAVMPAYETDVMVTMAGEQYATRVHSLPAAAQDSDTSDGVHAHSADASYLNRPLLVEGSWPTREGECVLSSDLVVSRETHLGDTLTITEGTQEVDDVLPTRTYTVVGYVSSPYYATSSSMGTTTLGGGAIQQWMYVPEADFSDDLPYTEAFVTVAGAAAEHASSDAYDALVADVSERIEALAPERERLRVEELKGTAQAELDDARAEYERQKADAQTQLDSAKQQLDAAAATIASSEAELASGQITYENGVAELAQQRAAADEQLAANERDLAAVQAQLESSRAQLEASKAQLDAGWAAAGVSYERALALEQQLSDAKLGLENAEKELAALDPDDPDYAEKSYRLSTAITQYEGIIESLEPTVTALLPLLQGQAAYNTGKADYDAGVAQAAQGQAQLAAARSQADARLASAQSQLDAAAAQLASGRAQLAQGRASYESGLAEYETQRADAERQLSDAEHDLNEAQRQIDELDEAEWMVLDRTTNTGVVSFEADANRIDSIAAVFPFIFFLVAALVALTTMTRMVEEERVLIGTYKALGYSRARIASKYLLYAAIASGVGSLVGVAVLSQVLPSVIVTAYAIIYFVPPLALPLPIDLGLAGMAIGLGVGVTLFATWAAATATLRERPATLMLPRAPKAGKRILLERIAPLWRRLSFSWKVTCRNLFRYKKRFVMTVIGIAGCTALLLTGLGLSDAINDIIDKQFGDIMKYNTTVTFDRDASALEREEAERALHSDPAVSAATLVQHENVLASGPAASDYRAELVVPEHPETYGEFFDLRTRLGGDPVPLDADGLVLSEKLARELGLTLGDTVTLAEQDAIGNATDTTYEATITGVAENYIYHYVFMGNHLYEQLFGEAPDYSTAFAIASDSTSEREQLADSLRATGAVRTVAFNDETIDAYRDMLSSVNMVVVVLVVAAAALAFIVLYNLTNINITERQREIATLKVLGFLPREVDAYIYRETMLLSLIGALAGLVFGVFMESFVVVTAEVDQVMFGREIHLMSFLIALVLTLLFTVFVMFAMRRKLAKINMVESLKSVE